MKWRFREISVYFFADILSDIQREIAATICEGGADFLAYYLMEKVVRRNVDYGEPLGYLARRMRVKQTWELRKDFVILKHLYEAKLIPVFDKETGWNLIFS